METRGALLLAHHANGNGLHAAATPLQVGRDRVTPQVGTWQQETWGYYDHLGEFRYGVMWLAQMISRCRLVVATIEPGGDEPAAVDPDKPPAGVDPDAVKLAVEAVNQLGADVGGESQLLDTLSTHLSVVGEGWLVGEAMPDGEEVWGARSADELRRSGRGRVEVIREDSTSDRIRWRELPPNSMYVRVWRPHKRLRYLADTPARPALEAMREIELVNRKIQAQYLSRIAMAGLIIFPTEVEFPVRPEFMDAVNPFIREWIEVASEAIQTPGSAQAAVPLPIKVPGEWIDKIRHIDFTTRIDERDVEKRESAIKRLATTMDLPAEVMLGMGDVNHWTAWQLEESGIKAHITPVLDLICYSLTVGYLRPRLLAAGVDPTGLVVHHDTSNLTVRPDRSADAFKAYDALEISGEALRRESGFKETDKPNDDQLLEMMLKKVIAQPTIFWDALVQLGLIDESPVVVAPVGEVPGEPGRPGEGRPPPGDGTPPNTQDESPPPPDEGT